MSGTSGDVHLLALFYRLLFLRLLGRFLDVLLSDTISTRILPSRMLHHAGLPRVPRTD